MREITPEAVRQSVFKLYPKAKGATRNRQVIVPTQVIINHAAGLGWCSPMKVKEIVTPEWAEAFAAHASLGRVVHPHTGHRSEDQSGAWAALAAHRP